MDRMNTVCSFSDPLKWGPSIWYMLDLMVVRLDPYNETLKNHILMQFASLLETIPCENCRTHYNHYMAEHPIEPHLHSKQALARWIYDCRSSVNDRIQRPNLTYDQYMDKLRTMFECDLSDTRGTRTLYNGL